MAVAAYTPDARFAVRRAMHHRLYDTPADLAALTAVAERTVNRTTAPLPPGARPVLRWRPDRTALPIDMAQSRDWHTEDDGT